MKHESPSYGTYARTIRRRVRREARVFARKGNVEKAAEMQALLADEEKFGLFCEQVLQDAGVIDHEHDLEVEFYEVGPRADYGAKGGFLDKLTNLLTWISEHWEQIAKIISAIMIMFVDEHKPAKVKSRGGVVAKRA